MKRKLKRKRNPKTWRYSAYKIVWRKVDNIEPVVEDEDEEVALFNRNVEPEVDEEFNREFARIMSESLESRKATSKAFDVEPPTIRSRIQSNNSNTPLDPQRIQFAVLSRRNKQVS